ncbi:indoleacetamide hydrolase [Labrys neptuniae]
MSRNELVEFTVAEAAERIRRREISSADYCEALIARCEAAAALNAFASWDWDLLRRQARQADAAPAGRLAGVPIALKDNIDTKALTTTAGTGALRGFSAGRDAPIAAALFAEGALLGGKANMHELALGITNNNAITGACRNPYDPTRIPGGSSGGTAVAVAARLMPAGIGTDTGGSVRIPAALCGCVGFRPSAGRYAGAGIVPISHTRDTPGPITRSVEDAMLLDAVLSGEQCGEDNVPRRWRLGVPRDPFYANLDPETAQLSQQALVRLEQAGIELVTVDIPDLAALNGAVSYAIVFYELVRGLPAYLDSHDVKIGLEQFCQEIGSPDVKAILASQLRDGAVPEALYRQAIEEGRPRLQRAYADYFAAHRLDGAIFPTTPLPARPIGEDVTVMLNGEMVPTFFTYIRNTDPGSNAGIPGISVPAGLTRVGLPVGIEIDGPARSDRRLLELARFVEGVLGRLPAPPLTAEVGARIL